MKFFRAPRKKVCPQSASAPEPTGDFQSLARLGNTLKHDFSAGCCMFFPSAVAVPPGTAFASHLSTFPLAAGLIVTSSDQTGVVFFRSCAFVPDRYCFFRSRAPVPKSGGGPETAGRRGQAGETRQGAESRARGARQGAGRPVRSRGVRARRFRARRFPVRR